MITRRTFLAGQASLLAAIAAGGETINAQTLTQLSRIVVGFPAGGAADTIARLLVEQLKEQAPKLIIDNKTGAGGRIALDSMRTSPADGSVLVLTPASMIVLYPHVYKKLGYDPLKDFTPVTTVCTAPLAVVVGPKAGDKVNSISDFVTWCKTNPKEAAFGTPGAGSMLHFVGEMLWQSAGIKPIHVPYRGGAPMMQDLIAGHVPAAVTVLSSAMPQVSAGAVRVLAITGAQRSPFLPEVPTLQEVGFKDIVADEWYGVLAPADLPSPLVTKLNDAIRSALKAKKMLDGLANFGFTATGESPEDFAALIRNDIQRWGQIVKASNYVPEE